MGKVQHDFARGKSLNPALHEIIVGQCCSDCLMRICKLCFLLNQSSTLF